MNAKEFINELLNNGYREFTANSVISPYVSRAFQKKVVDDKGVKYFLTCYYYSKDRMNHPNIKDGFEFDLQFNKVFKDKDYTLNVKVFSFYNYIDDEPQFYPLTEIEDLVEELFQKQNFTYYD